MLRFLEKNDWLGHIVEALVMAAIVACASLSFIQPYSSSAICGLFFAAGHFHGREKRDYENKVGMQPPHLKGYFIWRWSHDQLTDFLPAAAVCAALSLFISYAW